MTSGVILLCAVIDNLLLLQANHPTGILTVIVKLLPNWKEIENGPSSES